MSLADLHTHTNFSDGELSPIEIINEAIERKIKYLSITDHDTLTGYKKATKIIKNSYSNQIILIPGVEISTTFEGWIFLLVQSSSDKCINPSIPSSNCAKHP